jgi:hypothetical protein
MKHNETHDADSWGQEGFEDAVAAALIACYETKVRKNRGAPPSDRLNDARIAVLRTEGPYIPSGSRCFYVPDTEVGHFDLQNDPLPIKGLHAMPGSIGTDPDSYASRAYLQAHYIRRAPALGKYWHVRKAGVLFEMLTMSAIQEGINGDRRFFTVTPKGEVVSCEAVVHDRNVTGEALQAHASDAQFMAETSVWASMALQAVADRRFCWVISAQESKARAHLGCMREEIKSLLYARSLPLTTTGRKRPILHLVEAHKRRMRSGIDVDISEFLRGQQTVDIQGTRFTINPPAAMRPQVSGKSLKFFGETQ